MPRKIIKRWSPDPNRIRKNPALRFMGALLHDPNLFHLNRHSVSVGVFVGLFIACLPIPGQIPLAALAAWLFRCNLPISIILLFITNPITFPFIFYAEYHVGARILMLPEQKIDFALTWHWAATVLPRVWLPLFLGAIITSLFVSCAGYLSVQWFWRWHVSKKWHTRKNKYAKKTHKK